MTEPARQQRNADMLAECYPVARERFARVIADLEAEHFRPRIQCAHRNEAAQAAAVAGGNSDVTWSLHEATGPNGEPEALAIDLLDDDHPNDPPRLYLYRLAMHARRRLCRTGILWRLKGKPRKDLDAAIASGDTAFAGPLGFDPCHLEVADVTYVDARHGGRPAR